MQNNFTAQVERITPEMAAAYLECNVNNNRSVRQDRVRMYMNDMLADNWSLNGESIKFDCYGNLVDGQHRLWAILQSGKTVPMLVARNVDENAFMTVDTNMTRTDRQMFKMTGMPDVICKKNAPACIRAMLGLFGGVRRPSHMVMREAAEANLDLLEWYYDLVPNGGNAPAIYMVLSFVAKLNDVDDEDILSFIRCAIWHDLSPDKMGSIKHALNAENFRLTHNRHNEATAQYLTLKRYLYSWVEGFTNVTSKTDMWPVALDNNYKLVRK